jgi:hypothetical protein
VEDYSDRAVFPRDGDLAGARALVVGRPAIATMAVQAGCTDCLQVAEAVAAQVGPFGIEVRVRAMQDMSAAALDGAPLDLAEATTSLPYPDGASFLSTMLGGDIPGSWLPPRDPRLGKRGLILAAKLAARELGPVVFEDESGLWDTGKITTDEEWVAFGNSLRDMVRRKRMS